MAAALGRWGVAPGDRVLLVYPPGLAFVAAFFGCLRAGVVAVPVYPPAPGKLAEQAALLRTVAADCGARVALTDRAYLLVARYAQASKFLHGLRSSVAGAPASAGAGIAAWPGGLRWRSTEGLAGAAGFADAPVGDAAREVAFLQYTSGSTSAPKGVMISHLALATNMQLIADETGQSRLYREAAGRPHARTLAELRAGAWAPSACGAVVSWLPQYHDMGLIGGLLCPFLGCGYLGVYLSPLDFLKNPVVWVEAMAKYGATVATAPDFGYALAARRARPRLAAGELPGLDLSRLRCALNGAGIVQAATVEAFEAAFGPCGLAPGVLRGAYGLAEHCVYVCGRGTRRLRLRRAELEAEGRAVPVAAAAAGSVEREVALVSCGAPPGSVAVRIVRDGRALGEGAVGEIWVQVSFSPQPKTAFHCATDGLTTPAGSRGAWRWGTGGRRRRRRRRSAGSWRGRGGVGCGRGTWGSRTAGSCTSPGG